MQPLRVILHDMLELLDLLAGKVWLRWRSVSLERVGVVLGAAGFGLPAGASPGSFSLRQDEGVGALAMLDLMKTSVAVITATTSAAAAAATCAALRPSPLLPSSAACNHQKCCQREPVVAQVVPQHHIRPRRALRLQVSVQGRILSCSLFFWPELPFKAVSDNGTGHR